MWAGWRGFYGCRGRWVGGEVDWESWTATQINREDVNWQASRRREQSLINERLCSRERVWERRWMSQHIFSSFCQSVGWPLSLAGVLVLSKGGGRAWSNTTTSGLPLDHHTGQLHKRWEGDFYSNKFSRKHWDRRHMLAAGQWLPCSVKPRVQHLKIFTQKLHGLLTNPINQL